MITLPDGVVPNSMAVTLIDFGGVQRPALGGRIQRVNRLGNRFRVAVTLPPLVNIEEGRTVVSRLLRAKSEGLRIEFQLIGADPGTPGTPRINGAGQAGSSLVMDGFTPGYALPEGAPLSIEVAAQHYLHFAAGAATANGSGQMTLPITPALRVSPPDNALVHVAAPMVEGLVLGEEWAWSYSLEHHVAIQFEIEEAA